MTDREQEQAAANKELMQDVSRTQQITAITKAPWYKEAAGTVAVFAWLGLIVLMVYGVIASVAFEQWVHEFALFAIALTASAYRQQSPRLNVKSELV